MEDDVSAAHDDCSCDDAPDARVTRRNLFAHAGAGGAALAVLATGARAASEDPDGPGSREPAAAGDRLVIRNGPDKEKLLQPALLELNAKPVTVYPITGGDGAPKDGDRLNRMLAVRLDPAEMDDETRAGAADGVVVYSAVCTHKACTIKAWKEKERHLRCHCHLSEYDALETGAVRKGPAKAPLAMAPAEIDSDGFIRLTGGFNREPGARN